MLRKNCRGRTWYTAVAVQFATYVNEGMTEFLDYKRIVEVEIVIAELLAM